MHILEHSMQPCTIQGWQVFNYKDKTPVESFSLLLS